MLCQQLDLVFIGSWDDSGYSELLVLLAFLPVRTPADCILVFISVACCSLVEEAVIVEFRRVGKYDVQRAASFVVL